MTFAKKLAAIAEIIPNVFTSGKKAAYDAFWDDFQQKGNLTGKRIDYMFAGTGWTAKNCVPKYDILSPSATYMLFSRNSAVKDVRDFKKANGEKVILDFSGTKELSYTFYLSGITYLETVDCTSSTNLGQMFGLAHSLETIELLKLCADGSNTLASTFNCSGLKNITISGTIGYSGAVFTSKVLTKTSITSIISALSDSTSGHKITLQNAAVTAAFGSIENEEWQALVSSKPNWTISLA